MHPLDSREGFDLSHVKSCLKRQSAHLEPWLSEQNGLSTIWVCHFWKYKYKINISRTDKGFSIR